MWFAHTESISHGGNLTARQEHSLYLPKAAGADVLWHFPMPPSYLLKEWVQDRNWVLYVEPKCEMLAKKLFQLDKQHEPASGAMIGAERPITLEERQTFQFGAEAAPRFTAQRERCLRSSAKKGTGASSSRSQHSPTRSWMRSPSPYSS